MNRLRHWLIAKLGASCHCCHFTSSAGHNTTFYTSTNNPSLYTATTGAWDGREEA